MKIVLICVLFFICILLCIGCGSLTEQITTHPPTRTLYLAPPSAPPPETTYTTPSQEETTVTVPTEYIKVTPLEILSVAEIESITGMSYYTKDDPYLNSDFYCAYLTEIHDVQYDVKLRALPITENDSLELTIYNMTERGPNELTKIEGIGDEAYIVEDTGMICFSRGKNYFQVSYTFEYNDKTVELCKTVCNNFDRYCSN